MTLTFDLLTLKLVSESRVTWATSVTILVFLALSVLDLGPIYAPERRQTSDVRRASLLNAPTLERGHIINEAAERVPLAEICRPKALRQDRSILGGTCIGSMNTAVCLFYIRAL